MLFRAAKPFIYLGILVVLISTACWNTAEKKETVVPEKAQTSDASKQNPPEPASYSGEGVNQY